MKKSLFGLALCGSLLILSACTNQSSGDEEQETVKQEISIVVDQEMTSMDSSLATDIYSINALNNVMEGLYRLTSENELVPAGAKEVPEVSADGLTYTIPLNEEAKWSDGTAVTADDYVFAWQKAVNPETQAEYGYLFDAVKNAGEILEGEKEPSELGISAVSDYELKIELATTTPYFETLLAFPTFFPQNEKFVTDEGEDYGKTSDNLIYNGPFTLSEFEGAGTDTAWTYQKNPDYWEADVVKLETIQNQVVKESSTSVNLFETGEVDDILLTGELAKQYKNDPAFVTIEKAGTTYLSYNQTKEEFQNINVRKAISYAIDREAIVNQILGDGSLAPTGLVPGGMSYSPETGEDFAVESGTHVKTDPEEAKKYWETAKKELGISELKIELLAYDTDAIKKVAEYLQSAITETLSGVEVKVSVVPVTIAIERGRNTEFDLFLFGWTADYADPSSFLDLFTTTSPHNYGKYTDSEYDKFVELAKGKDSTNLDQRWQDYIQAEQILMKDMGVAPLIQKSEARLRNPALKGIVNHSAGAQFDYKKAYLEEE